MQTIYLVFINEYYPQYNRLAAVFDNEGKARAFCAKQKNPNDYVIREDKMNPDKVDGLWD